MDAFHPRCFLHNLARSKLTTRMIKLAELYVINQERFCSLAVIVIIHVRVLVSILDLE